MEPIALARFTCSFRKQSVQLLEGALYRASRAHAGPCISGHAGCICLIGREERLPGRIHRSRESSGASVVFAPVATWAALKKHRHVICAINRDPWISRHRNGQGYYKCNSSLLLRKHTIRHLL
ncbi:hypothetical protein K491DRAFT_166056 [Lophiostoma macrostomum CBS 122681]|uniref:Uncharacterized protein n=1 Tax=Lophiostoma macrostomum CBS 122681 TaxID=1314788 RepID=A0A6A6TK35_9PLEO|nr:hypothetical protein K491DRAFT_166056 [Lophiostoma macrostomum CBS 122681]